MERRIYRYEVYSIAGQYHEKSCTCRRCSFMLQTREPKWQRTETSYKPAMIAAFPAVRSSLQRSDGDGRMTAVWSTVACRIHHPTESPMQADCLLCASWVPTGNTCMQHEESGRQGCNGWHPLRISMQMQPCRRAVAMMTWPCGP